MVRQFFNEIIKINNFTLEEWKKVKIKVKNKKGDVENMSNYRPICSLLALYKLFSTILYGRFCPMFDQKQAEDQAGFRKTYQTTDHFATYRLIEQKCHEWGIKMWIATVDFTKAFVSISHNSIWEAFKSCNVDHEYVSFLRKMCRDQKDPVQTDEESKIFDIPKGSKQGDPMSSLLFNTVLQYYLKEEIKWQKKKRNGWIHLSNHDRDCLTILRFADDVMLFAISKEQIRKMMCDFKKATEKVGLRIHPDKTKILSNQSTTNSDTKKHVEVGGMSIEILTRYESVKYLGQRISFYQQETKEIKSRIRAAWATFHKYRQELTSTTTCSNIVYGFSTPQFLRLSVTPRGRGLRTKNTKEWFNRRNARCYDSLSRQKGKNKKIEKQNIEPKEEIGKVDITEMCSTDDESGDCQSTKTQDDVDSEVTCEDDLVEEMDATTIEEEEWIDYIKRSTVDALEKMEPAKIRCWNRTHKKWNGNWHWELQHHRVKDGWKRLLNGTQIWVHDIKLAER